MSCVYVVGSANLCDSVGLVLHLHSFVQFQQIRTHTHTHTLGSLSLSLPSGFSSVAFFQGGTDSNLQTKKQPHDVNAIGWTTTQSFYAKQYPGGLFLSEGPLRWHHTLQPGDVNETGLASVRRRASPASYPGPDPQTRSPTPSIGRSGQTLLVCGRGVQVARPDALNCHLVSMLLQLIRVESTKRSIDSLEIDTFIHRLRIAVGGFNGVPGLPPLRP